MRGVILAGGRSRRMGRDKALLPVAGQPLLARLVDLLERLGLAVAIVGRTDTDSPCPTVPHLPDAEAGQGPLGGLVTALDHWQDDCLLLACDLPACGADLLGWLLDQPRQAHGVVPRGPAGLEPCCAIYRVAVRPLAHDRLASGRRSLHGLIEAGDFATPTVPGDLLAQLANANTPTEFTRIIDEDPA